MYQYKRPPEGGLTKYYHYNFFRKIIMVKIKSYFLNHSIGPSIFPFGIESPFSFNQIL